MYKNYLNKLFLQFDMYICVYADMYVHIWYKITSFLKYLFGYASLSWGMRDLVPWLVIKLGSLHWEQGILAIEPSGKF